MKKHTLRNLIAICCAVVLLAAIVIVIVVCSRNGDKTVAPGPETGMYYYDADDGDTYYITLSDGDNVLMQIRGESYSGTYALENGAFAFALNAQAEIAATYADNVIALTYDGSSMRFVRIASYTVTYETNGGSKIDPVRVVNGKTAAKPADPVRDNYVFLGWYADPEYKTAFSFGAAPVTKDTTVYARWSEKLTGAPVYTVDFDLNYDGAEALSPVQTVGGKLYSVPVPTRDGYTFRGWWISDYEKAGKLTYLYEDQTFDANTTLFALWASNASGKIATPTPRVVGDSVVWDAVEGARSYNVEITGPNGMTILSSPNMGSTSASVKFSTLVAGEYRINVQANAAVEANNSEIATRYFNNKALPRVSLFSVVEPSVLTFAGVEGAENYKITVVCGNSAHRHTDFDNGTSTYFSFANCDMAEHGIAFTVTASATGRSSSTSETFYYNRVLNGIENFYFDDETETVSWDAVPYAVDYSVRITVGTDVYEFETGGRTSVDLRGYSASDIKVGVTPRTFGYNSPAAGEYTYERTGLAAPSGIKVEQNLLTWNAVAGATSYTVKVDGHEYAGVTGTEYDLNAISLTNGVDYEISIRAEGAKGSVWSAGLFVQYYSLSPAIVYTSNTVYWRHVIGAVSYQVKVNDAEAITVAAGVNSAAIKLTRKGENKISVRFADEAGTLSEQSITVFAYEIQFDAREGSPVDSLYLAMGDTVVLPQTERDGFELNGWYNVPGTAQVNGSKFADGSKFSAVGDMILYANWTPRSYNVTYEVSEGESVDRESDTVVYTDDYRLAVPTTDDTSRTFVGWYDAPNGQGNRFTDSEGYSIAPWTSKEDKILYPYWVEIFKFLYQDKGTYADTYSVVVTNEASRVSKVVVPETYNGKDVLIVEGSAFNRCSTLKTIEIPDTVKIIYYDTAFEGCTALEAVNIYSTGRTLVPVFSSDNGVLYHTNEVAEEGKELVFIPVGITGNYVIPDDVQSIKMNAFTGSRLTSVTIPSSVSNIAVQAFKDCKYITDIYFDFDKGDELVVGEDAFAGCTALKSLTIPARYTSFNPAVIGDSAAFENIYVADDHETYSSVNGMLCNKSGDTILYCPTARRGALRIPTGIRTIGKDAFRGCVNFTSITIPSFVKTIEDGAFAGCTKLTSVTFAGGNALGDALTIGKSVFENCTSLSRVTFENNSNVVAFGDDSFKGCVKITSITLPKTVKDITSGLFAGCSNLVYIYVDEANPYFSAQDGILFNKDKTQILFYSVNLTNTEYVLPETVTTIAPGVFSGNVSLQKIVIGNRIETIGEKAFYQCPNLRSVVFVSGGTGELTIGSSAFESCGSLQNLYVASSATAEESTYTPGTPATLRIVGEKAFYSAKLGDLVLSEGVEEIHAYAFSRSSLTSVSLPASLRSIGENAFYLCRSLESATVAKDSSLQSIATYAFYSCPILTFTVPKSVITIEDYAFGSTILSGGFFFEDGREEVIALGVSLFGGTELTSITFPDLCDFAYDFSYGSLETTIDGANKLTEIKNMPANDKYLYENGVFYILEGGVPVTVDHAVLFDTNYVIPNTVTRILQGAFGGCSGSTLTFEPGGTEDLIVEDSAFNNSRLVSVAFPARLKELGASAFYYSSLESITFEDTEADPCRLEAILEETFAYMENLTSIRIPSNVKSIGEKAFTPPDSFFGGGSQLVEVILPEGLESIGDFAFGDDSGGGVKITELHIPSTVKVIGNFAFANNDALQTIVFDRDADGECQIEILGMLAFRGASITEIVLPKTLAGSAYEDGAPNGVLAQGLFYGCRMLTTVTFEDGCPFITSYGDRVFSDCTSYAYIDFPVNLEKVGEWGSSGGAIKSITIPNFFDEATFLSFVPSLTGVLYFEMEEGNPNLYQDGENGAIYNKAKTKLLYYPNCYTQESYTLLESTTEIANRAFYENKYLKRVTLPEGLEKIGDYAFGVSVSTHSTALTEITIPSTVKSIGERAFFGCDSLRTVTFARDDKGNSALTYIGSAAFRHCTSLTEIVIPDGVTTLGVNKSGWTFDDPEQSASVFYECTALESVTLPKNLVNLQSLVFGKCTSLKTVNIQPGSALTRISQNAFDGSGLVTLDFTNAGSLNEICDYAFYNCESLKNLTFGTVSQLIIGAYVFANTAVDTLVLPANVISIGDYAFHNVHTLTSVTLGEGSLLMSIGEGAFYGTAIDAFAFDRATKLETIGAYAFYEAAISEIVLPDSVVSVGDYAFYGCEKVETLTLSRQISEIGDYAFAKLGIADVTIYGNNTSIGTGAFEDCTALAEVTLHSGIESIGNFAFGFTAITSITLPDTVSSLNGNPFAGCALESIEILSAGADLVFDEVDKTLLNADKTLLYYTTTSTSGAYVVDGKITSIMPGAFAGSQITSIVIPDNFTTIADGTFRNCTSLESITVGKNITMIGASAFEGCTALESVAFEKGGTQVLSIGAKAFKGCTALKTIEFPDRLRDSVEVEIEIIDFGGGMIFENEIRTGTPGIGELAFEASGLVSVTFEQDVSGDISTDGYSNETLMVGKSAFRDCVNLESVVFNTQLSEGRYDESNGHMISDYAFYNCSKLTTVTLPEHSGAETYDGYADTTAAIGSYAFTGCTSLASFSVPCYLLNFLPYCFSGSGLTSFEFPRYEVDDWGDIRVQQYMIGEGAFSDCTKLTSFVSHGDMGSISNGSEPELGAYAFKGCTSLKTVVFDDMYAVLDGVFEDCTSLESVSIHFTYRNIWSPTSDGVMLLGANVFRNCSKLTSVSLTGDLESIGANAFAGCTSLMEIAIPSKVMTVASTAFSGWTAQQKIRVPFANADSVLSGWNTGWNADATVVYAAKNGKVA